MQTTRLRGAPLAERIRADVADRVDALRERGVVPTLGTVIASDDPADERFLELKHEACAALGIATRDRRFDPASTADHLARAVASLSADHEVHAVFVQAPLPEGVDATTVRERVAPAKDVDCFHPATLGRLVAGDPRFVPATTAAVCGLLDFYDVATTGADVTVVGRSPVIGLPLANRLAQKPGAGEADDAAGFDGPDGTAGSDGTDGPDGPGDATVTVCHSGTADLAAKTRGADVVVTAAGVPGLVDGEMVAAGATVVDVSATRVAADTERGYAVVGDVDADTVEGRAGALTPVPGGVGPVTIAALLKNVVRATERRAAVE